MSDDEFFDSEPFEDPLEREKQKQKLQEEQSSDGGEEKEQSGPTMNDIGAAKGLYLYGKYLMGMDIGEYESIVGSRDEVTVSERHKDLIAPSGTNFEPPTRAVVGQDHTISTFTNLFDEEPENFFLKDAFEKPSVRTDYTVFVEPYDEEDAKKFLRTQVDSLRADFELSDADNASRGTQKARFQNAQTMLDYVEQTDTRLFDIKMYTTVRGTNKDVVNEAWKTVKPDLTSTDQVRATYVQDKAVKSTSPIAKDFLGYDRQMLSGGLAAMLPMTSKYMLERGGVNMGMHGVNMSPLFVDRFEREGGFNQLTIGAIGSGKSFSTKLQILREYAARDDLTVIILDPLEGFVNFVERLGGQRVVVGGSQAINPMELRQADEDDALEAIQADEERDDVNEVKDPFNQKIAQVEGFLRSYFKQEGISLGEKISTLRAAVVLTYNRAGIDERLSTHGLQSPTISDLIDVLYELSQDPSPLTYNPQTEEEQDSEEVMEDMDDEEQRKTESEAEQIERHATELLNDLRAFREGEKYDMLAKNTEVNIMNSDIVYLDISANEMDTGHQGLMMQLLFDAVYQRSKETDNKVLFAIDEAHVMMQDKESLNMLETAVRHSRHYDMSINFITQEVDDFFANEQAKAISNNTTIRQIHRVESFNEDSRKGLGLNQPQAQSVPSLKSGKQQKDTILGGYGYSEAFLYIHPEGWFPAKIVPSDPELTLVDGDETNVAQVLDKIYNDDKTRR